MAKLRIGICGFGGLGHVHARSLAGMEDVEVVSVCDIDPAKLVAPAQPAEPARSTSGTAGLTRDLRPC